jgi:hypothetical protein
MGPRHTNICMGGGIAALGLTGHDEIGLRPSTVKSSYAGLSASTHRLFVAIDSVADGGAAKQRCGTQLLSS